MSADASGNDAQQLDDAAELTPSADAATPADATAREVACVDEQFARLMLFEATAAGVVREEGTQAGVFESFVDASAGGLMVNQSFVYARFGEHGLEKIDVGDEGAFTSTAWDIAFRRYVVRINSGVGGPGDVTAASTAPGTTFDALSAVPVGLEYEREAYFSEACEYVADMGIGSPATVLSSFWTYTSCVEMTGNVYVLALSSGRHVKLEVLSYYPADNQRLCNETGMIAQPSGAGQLRIRWAFLD